MTSNSKFSIERFKAALEAYDWERAKEVIDESGGPSVHPQKVAEGVRRAGRLLFPYPGGALEKKRDGVVAALENYMSEGQPSGSLPQVLRDALGTLSVAEAGYRKLVGELANTDASRLEPSVHVAAAIRRAENELSHLLDLFNKQSAQTSDALTLQMTVIDDSGNPVDMDGALEHFVGFVSMTLQMEAHKGKWFDTNEHIVLPDLPEVSEDAIYQAGSTLLLASVWQRWRKTEEKARVLGRTLRFLDGSERPKEAPAEVKSFIVDEGDTSSDLLHRVALERVTDKMSQNLVEIRATVSELRNRIGKTEQVCPLPPLHWVSHEEVHAIHGLADYLAYDVVADKELPGGLRLVEWVRGYCALMALAKEAKASQLCRTKSGWQYYFAGFGLTSAKTELLIAKLTFKRSSRDLFDHPFIKLADGRYRLFSPALRAISVPIVLLSTLSNLGVQLQRKGKGFEQRVKELFESAGLKAYSFKEKRGDAEYEFDAVIPWGDYLFLVECKNRSLPFGSPVQMHYFDLETKDNIRQIQRLVGGLREHPDILEKNVSNSAVSKTLVPILLNCFPYSAPGPVEGVYLYDFSSLSRFFLSGEIMLKSAQVGHGVKEFSTGVRLWEGDKPAPDDLLAQLGSSNQFDTVRRSLIEDERGFPLPPDGWVFDNSYIRLESSMMAEARAKFNHTTNAMTSSSDGLASP